MPSTMLIKSLYCLVWSSGIRSDFFLKKKTFLLFLLELLSLKVSKKCEHNYFDKNVSESVRNMTGTWEKRYSRGQGNELL